MNANRITAIVGFCLMFVATANAAPLPCVKSGTERWPIKTTLPSGAKATTMTLDDALKLQRLEAENRQLREDNVLLKRASAILARELE